MFRQKLDRLGDVGFRVDGHDVAHHDIDRPHVRLLNRKTGQREDATPRDLCLSLRKY